MQLLSRVKELFEKKKPAEEYFLALLLKEREVKAVIWEEKEGQVSVVDSANIPLEGNLDSIEDEKLLELCDQAIGLAEKTLPAHVKTTKTIFGLNDWWVEGATIKEPYFSKIKRVSKALELTPLGFVVLPEAIAHLLKIEEGTPPTVLLVAIGQDTLGVTLVRSGRIEATKTLVKEGKSDSELAASVIKSFGNVEILPSRMLLFDGEVSLEETKQEFISYPWMKELSFLHFPKIDILSEDFDARAVVFGAAKEMGFSLEEEAPEAVTKPEESDTKEVSEEETTFGFVKERDVVEEALEKEDRLEDEEDVKEVPQLSRLSLPSVTLPKLSIAPLIALFGKLGDTVATARFPFKLWFPLGIATLIVFVFLAVFLLVPKATITLVLQTRTLENEVQITLDPNVAAADKEKKRIPASAVETKLEGEKSQAASGKKMVGEKAVGEVTIYNKTENRKTFSKGTVLAGPSDLRFTLDEEVTVASTAAFELTPSSTKAKVTAAQIGEESNLPANTNLPFKDFPTASYFAKNEVPLSGGTKREVVVVSKEDHEKLLETVLEELRDKAREELVSKSGGNRIVAVALKEEIASKKYSKNVDEEAQTVTLTLAISFSTLSYKDSDLLEIVGSEIEKDVPQGFTFAKDKFETSVKTAGKEKAGATTLLLGYKAILLPNLDIASIKSNIAGKSKVAVEKYLASLPLERFSISQNVEFPGPLNLLPQRSANIVVEVTSN